MKRITEETKLGEILENKELFEILEKYNFPCLGCPLAKFELENLELGQICKIYNIDAKKLIKELNEKIKE
jgi:hybrid cluster-associated redox disulfide protein